MNSEGNADETKKQEIDLRQKQTTRRGTVSHFMAPNLENIFLQFLSPHWYAPSTLFSPGLEFTTSELTLGQVIGLPICFLPATFRIQIRCNCGPAWKLGQHSEASLGLLLYYIIRHKEYIVTESTKTSLKMVGEFGLPSLSHY